MRERKEELAYIKSGARAERCGLREHLEKFAEAEL